MPGPSPIGVRLRRLEQRPCSIRTPFVMPGLGPGIHEFRRRRRGDRRRKSDPVSPDKPFPLQLVDARAKPWHDGGEVARALDGDFKRRRGWASCSEDRASQPILTPMGPRPGMTRKCALAKFAGGAERDDGSAHLAVALLVFLAGAARAGGIA